jgi:GNAT superfamily N-acetyltransferase
MAGPADADVIARHRVAMFHDMGAIDPMLETALYEAARKAIPAAITSAEYVAWVAETTDDPSMVIGGAGVQIRSLLPRPDQSGRKLLRGIEGSIMNVFVEPEWRRRGIARTLMEEVLAWARTTGIVSLVLHASEDGRALYESMGFVPTNEMRFTGSLDTRVSLDKEDT